MEMKTDWKGTSKAFVETRKKKNYESINRVRDKEI